MPKHRPDCCAGVRIPQSGGCIHASRREQGPVGAETNIDDVALMLQGRKKGPASGHIEDSCRAVFSPTGDVATIRGKDGQPDTPFVAAAWADGFACHRIPDASGSIIRGRNQAATIR